MWNTAWMTIKGRDVSHNGCWTHANVHSVFVKPCAGSLLIHHIQVIYLGITKNVSDGLQWEIFLLVYLFHIRNWRKYFIYFTYDSKYTYFIDFSPCSVNSWCCKSTWLHFWSLVKRKRNFPVYPSQLYGPRFLLWYPALKQPHVVKRFARKTQLRAVRSFAS